MSVAPFTKTLDQELVALARGVTLECLVCGEFLLRLRGVLACPECSSILAEGASIPKVELPSVMQAG